MSRPPSPISDDKEGWLEDPYTQSHRDYVAGEVQKRHTALLRACADSNDAFVTRSYERYMAEVRMFGVFSGKGSRE